MGFPRVFFQHQSVFQHTFDPLDLRSARPLEIPNSVTLNRPLDRHPLSLSLVSRGVKVPDPGGEEDRLRQGHPLPREVERPELGPVVVHMGWVIGLFNLSW